MESRETFVDDTRGQFNKLSSGTVIDGRFEIIQFLGAGATGAVYSAKALLSEEIVALKILHSHLLQDQNALRRFLREARAAARLADCAIVRVLAVGADSALAYIVMEYVDGITLRDWLRDKGVLSPGEFLGVFYAIAGALHHAHEKGVLHRDIKPANIMVLPGEQSLTARIVDLGLAGFLTTSVEQGPVPDQTMTNCVAGSPAYMSPEQCTGQPLDERSDIYSLGCAMFESLTGRTPFIADSGLLMMQKQLNDKPVFPHDCNVHWSLQVLIFRCLEKDPANRYGSCKEIQEFLAGADTTQLGLASPGQKKRNVFPSFALPAFAGLVLIAALCVGVSIRADHHKDMLPMDNNSSEDVAVRNHPDTLFRPDQMSPELLLSKGIRLALVHDPLAETYFREGAKKLEHQAGAEGDRVDFLINLIDLLHYQHRDEEAKQEMMRVEELLKIHPELVFYRIRFLRTKQCIVADTEGNKVKALGICQQRLALARGINGEASSAYSDYADLLLTTGKKQESIAAARLAVDKSSDTREREVAVVHLARLLLKAGCDKEYQQTLKQVKVTEAAGIELCELSEDLYQGKRYAEAENVAEMCRRALEKADVDPVRYMRAYVLQAACKYNTGDFDRCIELCNKVVLINKKFHVEHITRSANDYLQAALKEKASNERSAKN